MECIVANNDVSVSPKLRDSENDRVPSGDVQQLQRPHEGTVKLGFCFGKLVLSPAWSVMIASLSASRPSYHP